MVYEPKIGDFVWAKMKGFCAWPGRVVEPGPDTKKTSRKGNSSWIYFFGTKNYGWIEDCKIYPFVELKDKFINGSKTVLFKKSVKDIEQYIKEKNEDSNYEVNFDKMLEEERKQATLKTESAKKRKKEDSLNATFDYLTDSGSEKAKSDTPKKPKKTPKRPSLNTSGNSVTKKSHRDSPVHSEENGVEELYEEEILDLPPNICPPESSKINLSRIKRKLGDKDMSATAMAIGFIGLGNMGTNMVMNLINSGHRVNLWNRTSKKCEEIKEQADANQVGFVQTYQTPCDVLQNSDIIFSCLADPRSAKEAVIGNCGVIHGADGENALDGKSYVEMTSIDPDTSKDICDIITKKGGRYLELQVQGSKKQAEDGTLITLAAGDPTLFEDCQSCIKAISKSSFFLGSIGSATKMNLCLNMAQGIGLVGFAESMVLAAKCGLSTKDFMNIFKASEGASRYLCHKGELINNPNLSQQAVEQALVYMQKDIKLCLDISNDVKQNLPVAAAANEAFKAARRSGYDQCDVATVYVKMRH